LKEFVLFERHEEYLPMIPLGLKETKEVDFFEQFSDFILEHYSVDPTNFEDAILDLIDTRQVRGECCLKIES
jgi:hypothetical protein